MLIGSHEVSDAGSNGPVFVIGCPRSGTSAFSWALAQHPDFWTSAESDFLQLLFGRSHLQHSYQVAFDRPDDGWLRLNGVDYAEFCSYLGRGLDELFKSRSGGRRWVDSSPGYTLIVPDLALLFPQARFIHLVRDGRAVVNSMLNSGFDMDWAADFGRACFTWAHYVRKGIEFESGLPGRVLRVQHAQLVDDPAATCSDILRFLGAPLSTACADFLASSRVNSSYGNASIGDIRVVKDPSALKERPWDAWSEELHAQFRDVAGASMQLAGIGEFAQLADGTEAAA